MCLAASGPEAAETMTTRRNLVIGAACAGAAGAAYALTPRKQLNLLAGRKMAKLLPLSMGGWSAEDADGLVQPTSDKSLAATLYTELVGRIYRQTSSGDAIMMLVAYGDTQSDLLQLHRPEACYPAVGFELVSTKAVQLPIGRDAYLPVRRVIADAPGRRECITYWTRLGDDLPNSASEQREVRLRTAMRGFVPDGALFRFSVVGRDEVSAFSLMDAFIRDLIAKVAQDDRPALLGRTLSNAVKQQL